MASVSINEKIYRDAQKVAKRQSRSVDNGNERRHARISFTKVIDIMAKDQIPKRLSTTSEKLCKKLFAYFERGSTCLEITRTGEGRETDYEIYPVYKAVKAEAQ